ETPLPGHAVEVVRATVHETQAGASDQLLDGAGDENLARCSARRYSCADVNGDAADVVAHHCALARVQPRSDLDPQRADAVANVAGAADSACGSIEGREEPVAERLHFATAEPPQLAADDGVVVCKQLAPAAVSERRRPLSRTDDVGE